MRGTAPLVQRVARTDSSTSTAENEDASQWMRQLHWIGNNMPQPSSSPILTLSQSVFNALAGYNYDSSNEAFDNRGTPIYMFVEEQSSGSACGQWNYGTNSEGSDNPRGNISQTVYDIFSGGTWNAASGGIDYQSKTYKFRLGRDSTGVHVVEEVEI